MALLVLLADREPVSFVQELKRVDEGLPIQIWPGIADPEEVRFAVTWAHPPGSLQAFPNLRVVASYGAGIDHILADHDFPNHVTVTRVVDRHLAAEMEQYILAAVLRYLQSWPAYRADQAAARWQPRPRPYKPRIGILGLGVLGTGVAGAFTALGFDVSGWSRGRRVLSGVTTYTGAGGLARMLPETDVLVNLLPLTDATRDILSLDLFNRLKTGAYLINVARGAHLVENDLLTALDSGKLSGACLDVFRQEPLPSDHPFWSHPKITITPHVAARTAPEEVAAQIADNYRRMERGEPLKFKVDLARGY
ncbi:MAG: glyoxylate/hydroxypyruvate reductase A [Acidobacteriota bacterium]|nr:glyoxylate/hydroxypyruvate reductase A [Acidobacteriota bacterium]